ncbi:MAG: hypothetical protein KAJ18_11865 [Candidatus Omnitrophica bacterium]|nr:hypothetical protein [Candidatus Omnitrophota bacterium]
MNEQTTIREAIAVARDWGPLWVTVVGFVIFKIIEKWNFKKKRSQYNVLDTKRDDEIQKLRTSRGEILHELSEAKLDFEKRMADIRVQLEKRITFNWMEGKILPKIDTLTETVSKLSVVVERDQSNVQILSESIPKLVIAIEKLDRT